ncbi:hypothetical protein C8J56DRAFT_766294, partial [Mycena floridula]
PTPSIYGALPFADEPGEGNSVVTFYLTSFKPGIMNCTVIGPQQRPVFRIVTDSNLAGYTVFKTVDDCKSIGLVEWQNPPTVELRGVLSKQRVKDWLHLSTNKTSRSMSVNGQRYSWIPEGTSLNLHTSGSNATIMARITRGTGTITVEMTGQALHLGLLESTIVATLILQSGRNID